MKILYVDSKDEIKDLKPFFDHKGMAVDYNSDYEKALYLANVNNYDTIVLDYTIAKDICSDIRKKGNKTNIIFLISNNESIASGLNSLKIGADDFLKKPINPEELYLRIVALSRRPKEYIGNYIDFEDFSFDVKNRRFYYKDYYIFLTKKECGLVDFFMRNNGILLSKDDLLENVWDMNANPFSNVVEVYIRSIRNKIKEYSNKEFIHNVPGVGYYIGDINRIKKDKFYNMY